jgi:putative transposase
MTRPYSEDLRVRAVGAVEGGLTCRQAAALFSVGVSSVVRWCQRKRTTGGVAAKPMGGKVKPKLGPERAWILARIEAEPSLTLDELRRELADRGVVVGHGTVWRFFHREKLTFKKNAARRRTRAA